jgi:pimeloyl-ACP methyl ester carboxylesterase
LERVHEILKGDEVASKVVPDFLGSLRRLLDQLDKKPVSVEITDPHTREAVRVVVGKWDLQFFMANQINKTYSLKSLAALSAQLFDGDLRPLARATLNFRRGSVGNLMPWEMLCSTGVSSERLRDIERRAVGTYLDNASNFPFPEIGEALSTRELGPEFRAPLHSKVPALFISGTLDGESPLASAKEIQDGFPNHSSLIVEGASHGWDLFYFAPGLKDQMVAFLSGRDLSSRRVNMLPFRFNAVGEGRE